MITGRERWIPPVAFLAVLAFVEYFIYFNHAAHFFQGDTIYWFIHRMGSVGEFFRSFGTPDPGGWYRPLTNRTIQSLLYPVLGFEPSGYRWIQYIFFFADIAAVYALILKLTRRQMAAAIGSLFFTIHTINAYTTYDLSFTPELVFTFFYICAALAFLSNRNVLSLVLFALSLCSKESAVTFPLTLVVLNLVRCPVATAPGTDSAALASTRSGSDGAPWISLIPHAVLLLVYLVFTLGYLGVASEALASLHNPPPLLETGGYYFMVGPHMITNAGNAWAWGLNLPTGMLGQWRDQTTIRNAVLWGFAALQMALLVYAIVRGDRRTTLIGFAWFWITASPALPLNGHFLPYYLFLPVVGMSIIVGATWVNVPKARFAIPLLFVSLTFVCIKTSRSEARNNFLLGSSSRIAEVSLLDMRALYPSIPHGTTFFIDDTAQPDLWFHQSNGGLFRLAYRDESLQFKYASLKDTPPAGAILLTFNNGHLTAR